MITKDISVANSQIENKGEVKPVASSLQTLNCLQFLQC